MTTAKIKQALAAAILFLVAAEPVFAQTPTTAPNGQIHETKMKMDSFGHDPGWLGVNNRAAGTRELMKIRQDFGFSARTGNAGGESPGEMGGFISPAGEVAFYGKAIEPTTLDEPLSATGTMSVGKDQ